MQKWEGGTRVQSAEDGVRGKVGAWHDRLQSADYRLRRKGRGVALPRPCFHRRTRRSLAPTRERSSREAARLARSANPTRYKVKRGSGERKAGRCKSANRPTACGKVQRLMQVGIALRAILEAAKVGAWLRRALVFIGGQGEALPLPASGARERQLGWHAVPTLPFRNQRQLGQHVVLPLPSQYPCD